MTVEPLRNMSIDQALADAEARFIERNPRSMERHQSATNSMPGGNSRSVLHFDPAPLTIAMADGCMIEDLDGHRYVDFLGEYSAGLYGHTNRAIQDAVTAAMECGTVLGAPNRYEADFAAAIVDRFPSMDLVRFCNSGSEANLFAINTARAATGRNKILAIKNGYHGGFLYLADGHSEMNVPFDVELIDYNDVEGAVEAIQRLGEDLAAMIVEPMLGAGGCIPGSQEFLETLRRETEAVGAILIFDEVITSRLSDGGLQKITGVIPDMTTIGKYLGGGLTFGGFGGRRELMERFDPTRPDCFYQSGTFNNNVLTMAAGKTGLTEVFTPKVAATLNSSGDDLRRRVNVVFKRLGVKAQALGCGSVMTLHFTDKPITCPKDLDGADLKIKKLFHLEMLERGQYLASRCMLTLSLPMGHPEFDGLVRSIEDICNANAMLLNSLGYMES